ncbi:hypothetical protein [Salinilacihabitans rarus]|uniref:hypothetical protein n=1 Tax=Salinilacihabitans rarus TaxID=2961596 RepID=UPI0020C8E4B0|nr:hypothetical protein [Salinilacihabitans rarus]
MNPFSRAASDGDDGSFDDWAEFVPASVPEPGPFLDGHDVLAGEDHVAFHEVTREVFEERGVYDATFGYNLARLNLDRRHPDAGYRYAVDADDPAVLRAEFTPTTPFCPQAAALAKGSFRAWNGLADRHGYDLVRVRVHPSHHRAAAVESDLADLEAEALESGLDDAALDSLTPDPTAGVAAANEGDDSTDGEGSPF